MKPSATPERALLLPATDASGRPMAHWIEPLGCGGEMSALLRDFISIRSVAAIARKDLVQAIVLPVSWSTLVARGDHYLRLLQKVTCADWSVCIEVEAPHCVDSLPELVRFATVCRDHRVGLGLKLRAAELPIGASLARATGARHVLLAADSLHRLTHSTARARSDAQLAALRSDRQLALVARADDPQTLALVNQVGPDWLLGLAVAAQTVVRQDCQVDRSIATPPSRAGQASQLCRVARASLGAAASSAATVASIAAVASVILTACSSVPIPAVPDGSARVPVNDPARLASFTQVSQAQAQVVAERSALYNEVGTLRRQIQDLRSAVKLLLDAKEGEGASPKSGPPPAGVTQAPAPGSRAMPLAILPDRSVEVAPAGMVFRVFHRFGLSRFELALAAVDPMSGFEAALRQAARDASSIEVCGYTDSPVADEGNHRVAWARADEARRWLVAQGVDATRIRTRYEPAGHFIGENGDSAGRGQNRRVELVFKGDMSQAAAIINRHQG